MSVRGAAALLLLLATEKSCAFSTRMHPIRVRARRCDAAVFEPRPLKTSPVQMTAVAAYMPAKMTTGAVAGAAAGLVSSGYTMSRKIIQGSAGIIHSE